MAIIKPSDISGLRILARVFQGLVAVSGKVVSWADQEPNGGIIAINPALPPVLTSLNFDLADIAGGASITITGMYLTGATSCVVDVSSATITANTSTSLTFTMPAKAAGSYNVQVTTANGSSNTLTIEAWSPAQITNIFAYLDSNKGVIAVGGGVLSWTDQSSNAYAYTQSVGANKPTVVSNAFGSLPGVQFSPEQWLDGTGLAGVTAWSYFAVAKWTSSDNTALYNLNAPLTIFGGSGWNGFGAAGGAIAYQKYDSAIVTRGSGLNDGNPHLIGVTGDATPDIKLYHGASQQGATASPGGTAASYYDHVGDGYLNSDGFDGVLGAAIVVNGVISGGDLVKLNKWSQCRFGAV